MGLYKLLSKPYSPNKSNSIGSTPIELKLNWAVISYSLSRFSFGADGISAIIPADKSATLRLADSYWF